LKYNKFYFLHISKTSGRHIRETIIRPIVEQLNDNGIEVIFEHHSHSGWHSRIDDKTYIISSLRDPAEQAISLYAHRVALTSRGEPKPKGEYDENDLTPKEFFIWMENLSLYPNFQTKNFLFDESFLKKSDDDPDNHIDDKIFINEELLKTRRGKVNLFLNGKSLKKRELEIQQKIFEDLEIDAKPIHVDMNVNLYNPESKNLYEKFSKEEIGLIRKYNSVDDYFYKNTLYF
jgi:hypothetical protein